jgi:uncharacterized protein YwqG
MGDLAGFQRVNTREASILHVGGLRPTNDPLASHFGLTPMALPGEDWPVSGGKPLSFVCQGNLTAAPFVPDLLREVKLLTFFVKPKLGKLKKESGADWVLRVYSSLEGLVPLAAPPKTPALKKGFECRWEKCLDHPNHDDPELVEVEGFDSADVELENVHRTKFGGYASTIQSEPWWGYQKHAAKPVYVFQINSEEKAGIAWGDGGTIYIARGTAAGCEDRWFLDWQCY